MPDSPRPTSDDRVWFKALDRDELADGRVKPVTCEHFTVCMTRVGDDYGALDNRCPHQGGPLGEGSIEKGLLRCPWHGWDYDPLTGKAPGFDDGVESFPVEVRDDGIYVGFPADQKRIRTVCDVFAETLANWGVKWVFGMVGHSNLGLADAFRRLEADGRLGYVAIRHEGAASFAVSAYGKLTGRPAACFAIAGPGATNLLTGLWDANVDRAPALALTGQVDVQVLGRGAFQEVDLKAAYGRVAQWGHSLLHSSNPAEMATLACKNALLNRGVSHVIFPDEVQALPADGRKPGRPVGRVAAPQISPPASALAEAVDRLRAAKRPAIIVGHGARYDMDAVVAFAEGLGCPVLTTFKAKGQIADTHPLGCGVLGRSGTPIASHFMNESDLLLVLGASFSNHTGITPKKPTIQVDFERMALGRTFPVDVPVWGEIGATLEAMSAALASGDVASIDHRDEIAERWAIWRHEKARRRTETRGQGINSATLFEALSSLAPDDAIVCVDVGNNAYSLGRYWESRGQTFLMSGYLGSIGFALPAALGAWTATQEDDPRVRGRKVISVSGDGGLAQYLAEFTTAVRHGMNLTHVVLHDAELGKISKEQRSGFWEVWQTRLVNPSFADFATSCGGLGIAVRDPAELDEALQRALAAPGPSLVEVFTDSMLI